MTTWTIRVCAILFSLVMFYGTWNGFQENRAFKQFGQTTAAEPIDGYTEKTQTRKKLGIKVGETKTNSAQIFFTTAEKQRIKVNRNIPDEVLAKFVAGEEVQVEYLPRSPSTMRFAGQTSSPFTAALFGLVSAFLIVVFWRKV